MFSVRQQSLLSWQIAGRSGWRLQTIVLATLLLTFVARPGDAADSETALIVSPISPVHSGEVHTGKLVWVDLVTTDPDKAVSFYSAVFGWDAQYFDDANYIELSHNNQVVSSVVRYEEGEAVDGDARWLVSVSVSDVDVATKIAAENGGQILESATDLPDRGRYSVISDTQGAVVMLLRATGGDPVDDNVVLDEWAWAELWTDDIEAAIGFYQAIAGYDILRLPAADGGERIVLGTDGKARATIVALPWDDVEPNWIPYIPVSDVANTTKRIVSAGGAVLVQSDTGDANTAIVMDPTGGVFAIQQLGAGK